MNAFLNGDLEEEVFMDLPSRFEKSLCTNNVCRLKKSLYGLKQSPRAWFERFGKAVKNYIYTQSQVDFKHFGDGKKAILIVFVDDLIMIGDGGGEIEELKRKLPRV